MFHHVAGNPLPAGHVLQPYTIARSYRACLQLMVRTRVAGLDAMVDLVASDRWRYLCDSRPPTAPMATLEAVFEWVRIQTDPALPSRLEAVFVWDTLTLATRYRATYRPDGVIHRCRPTTGLVSTHDGALIVDAFEITDLANPTVEGLLRVEERAGRYWLGSEPMDFPEVLINGKVVVEGIVDLDEEIQA